MMLSAEITALRRIGATCGFNGERIPYAFGSFWDDLMPVGMNYDFDITLADGTLHCQLDVYTAVGFPAGEFDVDAWTDQMISLTVPATRAGYYALQSTARAVLKGYRVVLPDGETIHVPELMKC